MKPIRIIGFRGMNGNKKNKGYIVDREGIASPRIVLNATVSDDNVATMRGGYTKIASLQGSHSLGGKSVLLCVAGDYLYRKDGNEATQLCGIRGGRARMHYIEIEHKVYMSNGYWKGIYAVLKKEVGEWGMSLPSAPQIVLTDGELPPGVYHICYTYIREDGQIGGNGEIRRVEFYGENKGIKLLNVPDNVLCWITDTNKDDFFLASVVDDIIVSPYYNYPLPSFNVISPEPMRHIIHAFGRIWGIVDNTVCYSEPVAYEWFKEKNKFILDEELISIAPANTGLYVNSPVSTWFLAGKEPEKMETLRVGDGCLSNVAICPVKAQRITEYLPVWLSRKGAVAGTHEGKLLDLTTNIPHLNTGIKGLIFNASEDNENRILIAVKGIKKYDDEDLEFVFDKGRMFMPPDFSQKGSGGIVLN